MKKRIFSIALVLVMLLSLTIPALAADEPEPEYRLTSVTETDGGIGAVFTYTFVYGQGGYLPTEVTCASHASCPIAVAYDAGERITSYQDATGVSYTKTYDEDGILLEQTGSTFDYDEAGNMITGETHTTYTYDEDGNKLTETAESTWDNGSTTSRCTGYAYDDKGNCNSRTYTFIDADGSETNRSYVYELTFDSEGRIATEIAIYDGEPGTPVTYAYDEEGGLIEETYDDGSIIRHYPMPLLDGTWMSSLSDGIHSFYLYLEDATGSSIFTWSFNSDGEPTLTYDDNGCLVRVDGAAGNSIELTYEPVA